MREVRDDDHVRVARACLVCGQRGAGERRRGWRGCGRGGRGGGWDGYELGGVGLVTSMSAIVGFGRGCVLDFRAGRKKALGGSCDFDDGTSLELSYQSVYPPR